MRRHRPDLECGVGDRTDAVSGQRARRSGARPDRPECRGTKVDYGQCHDKLGARVRLNHWCEAGREALQWTGTRDFAVRRVVVEFPQRAGRHDRDPALTLTAHR